MADAAAPPASPSDVAKSHFAAVAARDLEAMASHWRADVVADVVPVGILRGIDELRTFFAQTFAAVPDAETVVERVIGDERTAAVAWRFSGTFSGGPFLGIDPTGRRIELRGADFLEVEEGAIARSTVYYDGMAFARGVGMLPDRDSGAEKAMFAAFNAVTKLRERLATL